MSKKAGTPYENALSNSGGGLYKSFMDDAAEKKETPSPEVLERALEVLDLWLHSELDEGFRGIVVGHVYDENTARVVVQMFGREHQLSATLHPDEAAQLGVKLIQVAMDLA